jgi:TRAP-type C4-dicarboxylate transport system permease small subunit
MEMNEYSLLYIPFLGAAWLLRSNGHITVDILDNLLSDKPKFVLNIAVCLLGIAMSAVLFWYGAIISLEMLAGDIRSLTALKFPQFYVLSVIPIGSFVLMLEFLRKLVCLFKPEWLQSSANTDPVGV